jgi:hypothetical protein
MTDINLQEFPLKDPSDYEDVILSLLDVFEPTSPTTFIGDDGTTVRVSDDVEEVLESARKFLDEDDYEDDDTPPWDA